MNWIWDMGNGYGLVNCKSHHSRIICIRLHVRRRKVEKDFPILTHHSLFQRTSGQNSNVQKNNSMLSLQISSFRIDCNAILLTSILSVFVFSLSHGDNNFLFDTNSFWTFQFQLQLYTKHWNILVIPVTLPLLKTY